MFTAYLKLGLAGLSAELKTLVGPSPFELLGVRSYVPVEGSLTGKVVVPAHKGCYLALASGHNQSTITFELVLNGEVLGRAEALALQGRFMDMQLTSDRYKAWYNGQPFMRDVLDRMDRMAAYALLQLEKAAQDAIVKPDFKIMDVLMPTDMAAVLDYFHKPVQLDYN